MSLWPKSCFFTDWLKAQFLLLHERASRPKFAALSSSQNVTLPTSQDGPMTYISLTIRIGVETHIFFYQEIKTKIPLHPFFVTSWTSPIKACIYTKWVWSKIVYCSTWAFKILGSMHKLWKPKPHLNKIKEVDFVPYLPMQLEYVVSISKPVQNTNISYWFKYQSCRGCSSHSGKNTRFHLINLYWIGNIFTNNKKLFALSPSQILLKL